MAIKGILGSGIGGLHQSNPVWDFDCQSFWRSENPLVLHCPGGPGVPVHNEVGGLTADYVYWDTGLAQYRKCTVAAKKYPRSGIVLPDSRSNFRYYAMQATDRRFTTLGTDVSISNPDMDANHIINGTDFSLTTKCQILNADESVWRNATKSNTMSASYSRAHGMLVKRVDAGGPGAALDDTMVKIYMCVTATGENEATATTYMKIREDGWYLLWANHPELAETAHYIGLTLAPGVEVQVELPQLETSTTYARVTMSPPPAAGTSTAANSHQITFARPVAGGTAREVFPASGWLAATVRMPYSSAWFTLPYGVVLSWEVDSSNFLQFTISSSTHNIAVDMDSGGAGQVFIAKTGDIVSWDAIGVVFTWGIRKNAKMSAFFVNGALLDVDSVFTLPAGVPTAIRVGHEGAGTASRAQCCIQRVAWGRGYLSRHSGRALSEWFKRQALPAIF
jgi:hypothetical protein